MNCEKVRSSTEKQEPLQVYSGSGGRGIQDWPDPMYTANVSCTDCHGNENPTKTEHAGMSRRDEIRKRCIKCHEDARYGNVLEQWVEVLDAKLKIIEGKLSKARTLSSKGGYPTGLKNTIENARHNYQLVKKGNGVHNIGYSQVLLDITEESLDAVLESGSPLVKKSPSSASGMFWYGDTKEMPPVRFDHLGHQKIFPDCKECHEKVFTMKFGSADVAGLLNKTNMKRGWFCGFCHDGENGRSVDEDCEICHQEM